ncbi:MAG: bifunctional folylpolyglutamate synthase/dihydrofolate synthase [Thermoanaerobaculia bacterium]
MRDQLRWLDSLQGSGIRPGLRRMRTVLRALGNPQHSYRTVIVAGTNGKGSTASTLASILTTAGVRTGLYTSPHLVDVRERWQIDGEPVSRAMLRDAVRRLREAATDSGIHPTYFEALTLVAFILFESAKCDLVVLEVGLGGRLDATNVTRPVAALVTPIGIDHTEFLGTTIRSIAREKAGVIHRGSIALTSNREPEATKIIRKRAGDVGSRLFEITADSRATAVRDEKGFLSFRLATPHGSYRLRSPLVGLHQVDNVTLAVRAAEELARLEPRITKAAIERGVTATRWRGRLERFEIGNHVVWVDGAHNGHAAARIAEFIDRRIARPRTIVFGIMGDKDVHDVVAMLLPRFDRVILTEPESTRAMPARHLEELARAVGVTPRIVRDPRRAILAALEGAERRMVICGSLYLAGTAVRVLDRLRAANPATTRTKSDTTVATPAARR